MRAFTETGVRTAHGEHPIDVLVLATGFDAVSGSMLKLNPKGRGGAPLKEKWAERFDDHLGITIAGYPNLFMIHGPGAPGVFFTMPLGAELQTAWTESCIRHLDKAGLGAMEPTEDAEASWDAEINEIANRTLYPRTDSWYTGANIPGKPRQFSATSWARSISIASPRWLKAASRTSCSRSGVSTRWGERLHGRSGRHRVFGRAQGNDPLAVRVG